MAEVSLGGVACPGAAGAEGAAGAPAGEGSLPPGPRWVETGGDGVLRKPLFTGHGATEKEIS